MGRGIALTLVTALSAILLMIAADLALALDENARAWTASTVYGFVLLTFAITCLWRPLRVPDERGLATLMEKADPNLRDNLLAAVELSNVAEGQGQDSTIFRELLQEDVAQRMSQVRVPTLLPFNLIGRWLTAAFVLALIIGIIGAIPASRARLLRVAAPWWVNIGSAASRNITLIDPADHANMRAPLGERLPVLIEVRNIVLHENPYLETDDGEGNIRQVIMNNDPDSNGTSRFVSSVKMESREMRFRFHADRHTTHWFSATAQEPPQILAFTKKYIFPPYAGLPPKVIENEAGQVEVLQGSDVDLTIELNQPVESAKLEVQFPHITNIVELLPPDPTKPAIRAATFNAVTNGLYLIKLVAQGGRPNREDDQYPIEAIPDALPEINITAPESDISRQPEDILVLEADASDDVNLKTIHQLIRVEGSDRNASWATNVVQLPNLPEANASIRLPLDLLKLDARPGDRVLTRLAAVDVKGQTNHTGTLAIAVQSAVFDTARIDALQPKREALKAATALREAVTAVRAIIPGNLEQKARDGALGDLRKAGDDFNDVQPKLSSSLAAADQALLRAIAKGRAGRDAAELALLGATVARMRLDWYEALKLHLPALPADPAEHRPGRAKLVSAAITQLDQSAGLLEDAARGQLAADEAAVLLDHADYLTHAQRLMNRVARADEGKDPDVWKRLARRQNAALQEVLAVSQLLTNAAPRFPKNVTAKFRTAHADLKAASETLQPLAQAIPPTQALLAPSEAMQDQVAQVAEMVRPAARNQFDEAAKARRELESVVGPPTVPVADLHDSLTELVKTDNPLNRARVRHQWNTAIKLLRKRTALEGTRPDSDHLFLKDLADAANGLENLDEIDDPPGDQLKVVGPLGKALESLVLSHELTELELSLKALAQHERWERRATDINTLRARDWDWQRELFRRLPPAMREAGLGDLAVDLIDNARGSEASRDVTLEMNERKSKGGIFGVEENQK